MPGAELSAAAVGPSPGELRGLPQLLGGRLLPGLRAVEARGLELVP